MEGLGKRIRSYRADAQMTQTELARAANVSKAYLSELESEAGRRPSADVVLRIAEALGVTIAELLGKEVRGGEPHEIPASLRAFAKDRSLSDDEARMLASIRFRGGAPKTKERWAFIYDAIRGSRHLDDRR
ncbi:MAG: helix-turn-helix domain-containing protein [Actinomycetota bacterium]